MTVSREKDLSITAPGNFKLEARRITVMDGSVDLNHVV